jgi:hypothetical protein
LTVKTTPVNTRALLLILEKIENNAEVEAKPHSVIKPKGAESKCKMELIDSCIPQKPKHIGFSDKQCTLCKKHGGPHKSHNTHDCHKFNPNSTHINKNGGAGSSRRMDMWKSTLQIRENTKGQILRR